MLEERDQVRWPDYIDGTADAVVVISRDGEGHKSAIAAAGDEHAIRVEIRLGLNPIEQEIDVFVRTFAK